MAMLARALTDVKSNIWQFLPDHVIRDAAAAVGHRYRDRKLGPVRTVLLLVLQLLAANASLAHARALGGYAFSVSALAQARARLPAALLRRVLAWLVARVTDAAGTGGPRVVLVDAFNGYAPDTRALRRKYRRPPQGKRGRCDYPQVRTVPVFDLASGLLLAQHHFPSDRHESPQLCHLLDAAPAAGVVRPARRRGLRPRVRQLRQPVPARRPRRGRRGPFGQRAARPPRHGAHARGAAGRG